MSAALGETPAAARPGRVALVAAWAPVVLWIGIITWLSSDRFSDEQTATWLTRVPFLTALGLSPAVIDVANLILRKSAHFVEYALLAWLARRAFARSDAARGAWAHTLAALALAVVCAALDEGHQATSLTRSGTLKDIAINAGGAVFGAGLGAAGAARRRRRAA